MPCSALITAGWLTSLNAARSVVLAARSAWRKAIFEAIELSFVKGTALRRLPRSVLHCRNSARSSGVLG